MTELPFNIKLLKVISLYKVIVFVKLNSIFLKNQFQGMVLLTASYQYF